MTYENTALEAFGIRVQRWRGWGLMTQVQLAQRAGVSQATISRVERGRYPKLNTAAVVRLAAALDVTVPSLLEETGFVPLEQVPGEWHRTPTWK